MKQLLSTLGFLLGLTFLGTSGALAYSQTPWATTGDAPYNMVQDSLGNIYTVDNNGSTVTKITPAGVSSTFAIVGLYPYGIAIDSADNLYVTNSDDSTVTKITPAGVATLFASTGLYPKGIVLDSLGNIYTANNGDSTVTKITPAGVATLFASTGSQPYDIAIDSGGNLYTSNVGDSTVTKITPAGVATVHGSTGSYPFNLAIDSLDNVYTADFFSNTVTQITPAGVSSVYSSGGPYPYDIAIDASNNLYITNLLNNIVTKVDTFGGTSTFGSTGAGPYAIFISSAGDFYIANADDDTLTRMGAPTISEVTPVPDPTADLTPDYTFNARADFGSSITYGGSCSSGTVSASPGNNTITFNFLAPGTYSDCTITVTDSFGVSNVLAVSPFTVLSCTPSGTAEALCNGVDDNCDGDVDEDFVLIDCDGPDLGVCNEGYIDCVAGVLQACTDTTGDDVETCNGFDDDCDTVVDNGGSVLCDDSNACTNDVCNGFSGCGAGTAVPGTYLTCVGTTCAVAPNSTLACTNTGGCLTAGDTCTCVPTDTVDVTCNGIDDDCDGTVDEEFGPSFCSAGVGMCQAFGNTQCIAGVESCDAVVGIPVPELCNGLDDDCDGINDNGGFGAGGPADQACDDADSCTNDTCFFGSCNSLPDEYHYECQGTTCALTYNPVCTPDSCDPLDFFSCGCALTGIGEDLCNGVDDDCDGSIDEDYLSVPCTDGVGACAANGTSICVSGAESCYGAFPGSPQPEICGNTIDEDCNGSDLVCAGCGDGVFDADGLDDLPGTLDDEQCDDGNLNNFDACLNNCTINTCVPTGLGEALCNRVDDDCDGSLDEDYVSVACTVGVGLCQATGVSQCYGLGEQCYAFAGTSQPEICGNGIDEDCNGSDLVCTCGNGIPDPGETCDDSNLVSGDGCSATCQTESCGDGLIDSDGADNIPGNTDDEQCDGISLNDNNCFTVPGGFTGGTLSCSPTCQFDTSLCTGPVCGDSIVEGSELCDDGNLVSGDGCSATCTLESCGDGNVDPGETCDDSNVASNDGCSATCQTETCGDGITQLSEQCDDANLINTDACTNACTTPICGDSITNGTDQCDDGNLINTDACTNACTLAVCGDSFIQPGETCDDSNTNPNDGCSATCQTETCGDGITNGTEQCDDANLINTDACTNACTLPVCGDGITNGTEACDDGNLSNIDTCTILCILTADPGITKTVDNPNPDLDGIISYFITVTNNGPATATGVVVTDIFPPGLTLITANVTGGALTLPTWTLATMAPATTETLTITASVDVTNPITNIATVTSTSPDIDPLNNQDQVTVNPQAATVQGHLFRDDNENQLQDPGEADLANISVRITDRNSFLRIAVTNASGDYTSIIPPGAATLEIDASDPDFPDDYVITVDTLLRTINALPGINPVHFFGIDIPDTVTTKNTKDKKKRSITVTLQRTLVATGIPLEAGAALGYFSLLAITALSLKRTRRW